MIEVYMDGCCEPVNPGGTAAYGVVILQDEKEIYRASKIFIPVKGKERETSNNVAEYSGFLHALEWLKEHGFLKERILFRGDSMLVINQMFGTWGMNSGFYIPIAEKAQTLLSEFSSVNGQWIPREENSLADELSKAELIKAGIQFRIQPRG